MFVRKSRYEALERKADLLQEEIRIIRQMMYDDALKLMRAEQKVTKLQNEYNSLDRLYKAGKCRYP